MNIAGLKDKRADIRREREGLDGENLKRKSTWRVEEAFSVGPIQTPLVTHPSAHPHERWKIRQRKVSRQVTANSIFTGLGVSKREPGEERRRTRDLNKHNIIREDSTSLQHNFPFNQGYKERDCGLYLSQLEIYRPRFPEFSFPNEYFSLRE